MKWTKGTRRWICGISLVFGSICLTLLLPRSPAYPSVLIFDDMKTLPTPPPTLFERLVPMSWGWLWQAREVVIGTKTPVAINAFIINAEGLTEAGLNTLATNRAVFTNDHGLRVWIAGQSELKVLGEALNARGCTLSESDITTAHEIKATLTTTTPMIVNGKRKEIGLKVEVLPRVGGQVIDLLTLIETTELITNRVNDAVEETVSLHTNVSLAGRFQIPKENGVFVLSSNAKNSKAFGLLMLATLPKTKK